jgi:2-polyprenyl-3-methyl-5-hydroxy-6-metoxy-1,4-benzoquinol methylase
MAPKIPSVRELHLERKKMWEASMSNHAKYINNKTGLFNCKFTENRPCPVCQKNKEMKIFNKSGGQYVKCLNCGMIYLNPVFTEEYLKDYYKHNHDMQSTIVENDTPFYRALYLKGLNSIKKHIKIKQRNILDIGCSSGFFLDCAKKEGWDTIGIELNINEADLAKKKGHQIYTEPFEQIKFAESFSAITLWDVFEHIKNGREFLNIVLKQLLPGGIIFLQIPNSGSLAARIMQQRCNMFDGLEHANLYNEETIGLLCKSIGLSIVNLETVIAEVGVLNNYLQYDDPYLGNTINKEDLMGIINEKDILSLKLGYKMQIVISKS